MPEQLRNTIPRTQIDDSNNHSPPPFPQYPLTVSTKNDKNQQVKNHGVRADLRLFLLTHSFRGEGGEEKTGGEG